MKPSLRFDQTLSYKVIRLGSQKILLIADQEGLRGLFFENEFQLKEISAKKDSNHPILKQAEKELGEYVSGKRKEFDVPVNANGTPFQKQVWQRLREIPYGATSTYGEVAKKVGHRNKARAVGLANHTNPLPIFIPCHRVIGQNGKLTGYRAGMKTKTWLLELEQKQ